MSLESRRDTIIQDTVILQQTTEQYVFVSRDGSIADANSDAFGVTGASGDEGDPVAVCRLGFFPVIVESAADNAEEKTELVVGADGEVGALPSSGGGEGSVVAVSEESTANDGQQTGAWIDCLSPGRSREIEA